MMIPISGDIAGEPPGEGRLASNASVEAVTIVRLGGHDSHLGSHIFGGALGDQRSIACRLHASLIGLLESALQLPDRHVMEVEAVVVLGGQSVDFEVQRGSDLDAVVAVRKSAKLGLHFGHS